MKDSIVEKVIKKYQERSELGQKKYNTTLDRKDLGIIDWINHAQEEAMDLCLYLEKIKQQINDTQTTL
jgi:succinate dehydrogenase flavin-adding protein (antitoxin of CptAB toxin-antitoxin module)